MKRRVIPSLTSRGWIKNSVAERADFILAYFFETAPSQSWMFQRESKSMQSLLQKHQHDIDSLIQDLTESLREVYKRYFEEALVDVSYRNAEEFATTGRADLSIVIHVVEDGQTYNLAREFAGMEGVFKMVAKEVNVGA